MPEYQTECQRPGWFEEQLAVMPPWRRALTKLHPAALRDIGAPYMRILPGDNGGMRPPFALCVEYGSQVFVYRWDGKKLVPASAKLFAEFVADLPPSVAKRKGWRNPCELRRGKVVKTAWGS